ncbi:colicin immunity domain-containing protein [Botrimarina hoheduenensis]|uniref:Bacterial self-protective colicin-like immunity n=1 Tax=Botrimarina hoheduenensis TaxID=2528000 RepID=A0A5C5WA86_9BACT|nr:colicin immunity domain-containing protein [Botrimarina hoheduenensis]TWT47796.1 Bacterial self-protective colicin-like immunity [Botrimarina hoheduenensis]
MSQRLLKFAEDFLQRKTPVEDFVDAYADAWRTERDNNEILEDDPITSEKLSTFFCLVDLYKPDEDREDYEVDEAELRLRMQRVFDGELDEPNNR